MDLKVGDWVRHTIKSENLDTYLRVEHITEEFIFFHDGTHSKLKDGTHWLKKLPKEAKA